MVHVNEFLSQKRAIFELKLCKKKTSIKTEAWIWRTKRQAIAPNYFILSSIVLKRKRGQKFPNFRCSVKVLRSVDSIRDWPVVAHRVQRNQFHR